MPHIGLAMERSLQDRNLGHAFVRLLSRSAVAASGKRDSLTDQVEDAADAFSSWDNCMSVVWCKWPVIALIILGGLILLSIVWCIGRCLCCGLSCCCSCCQCFKCCGECCGMCDPPGGRRNKHLDEPFVPPHHDQAYRPQAPMHSGFEPAKPSVPQYAVFDTSDKKDADSLPAMPVWGDASSQKMLVEEEAVEMEPLKKPVPTPNPSLMNVNNASHAALPGPGLASPGNISPYGAPPGAQGFNGYVAAGHSTRDPYGAQVHNYDNDQSYGHHYGQDAINDTAPKYLAGAAPHQNQNHDDGYGYGYAGQGPPQYQSRSPQPYNDEYGRSATPTSYNRSGYRGTPTNDGYGQHRGSPAPQAGYGPGNTSRMRTPVPQYDGYSNDTRRSPAPQAGYGAPARTGTPGAGYGNARRSPGPQAAYDRPNRSRTQDDYFSQQPAPARSRTQDGYIQHHPPAPRRQYTGDSHTAYARADPDSQYSQGSPPVSPIQNNSGFDFNSGYSRQSPAPAPEQSSTGGPAYPGYRSYKPAQSTQQQNWDPIA
ncbi:hypothetical protein F5Y18DRAFT_213300 [Xylariaceae sp. FL1019]|nr:hypothetical protein F5Y18DRAFT_213300 [Xylariaceae sp. FL1019]